MIDDFRSPGSRTPTQPNINLQPQPVLVPVSEGSMEAPAAEEPVPIQISYSSQEPVEPPTEIIDATGDEELAALETPTANTATSAPDSLGDNEGTMGNGTKPPRRHFWQPPYSKKQKILSGAAAVLVMFGAGAGWTALHHTKPVAAQTPVVHKAIAKKAAPPPPLLSNLTGLPISDASVNQRPVTGVMIENSPDARPQSGLDQAGVVFEAIAEGGITRFLALYQDSQPDYLGPVRSARPYYVQWCMGFDCSLAHVGGSPEALQDIPTWGTKNLDQFANAGAFWRISSRYAPHNMYTDMAHLNDLEKGKGYGASSYSGFARKADQPYKAPAAQPSASSATPKTTNQAQSNTTASDSRTPASSIDMAISGYYYNTHYDYDAGSNSYKRSEGGAPHLQLHKDGSKVQIQPKVVVAMVMQYGLEADDHHSQYNVIGSGQAYIFQDGTVTQGTWAKSDMKSALTFTDANGKAIPLDAGQTWLTALSAANQVTYK